MGNQEIVDAGKKYVMNTYGRFPIAPVRGKGSLLWDADGKEYVDFVTGLAVTSLGHSHDEIAETLASQAKELLHTSNLYWIKPQVDLAQKLVENSGFDKAFFANSGAEANEGAIKLARKYAKLTHNEDRYEIITMKNSFHGRTMATLTATGQEKVQQGFSPLLEGFVYAPFNDVDALTNVVTEKTCAIMLEVVQGEGGVRPIEMNYLQAVNRICQERDILLIIDEVQSGIGRTGKLFAHEHFGVKPHIMTLAKALGNGTAIGAMLAVEKVAQAFQPGDHASTFGGNYLAAAVGNKVIEIILRDQLLDHVLTMGEYIKARLESLKKSCDRIVEVRGLGLFIGIEITGESIDVVKMAMEKGLLLSPAGKNVVRLLPPLNVDRATVDRGLSILETCFENNEQNS